MAIPYRRSAAWITVQWLIVLGCAFTAGILPSHGQEVAGSPGNDTLLMFVGEKIDALTLATRREESAWQAPAVAQVITREQMREKGISTLSQALSMVPGFYMAQKEGVTQPYLRGISNSILFLYDTVPIDSEVTKSLHALDQQISLESVKRIEIIRGPGSVLWGPDAFGGVVNIVPLDGKDVNGGEVGLLAGEPGGQMGAYAHTGGEHGAWDGLFSVSARKGQQDDTPIDVLRFWGDDITAIAPQNRLGRAEPDHAHYLEATGRAAYKDKVFLSGRVSDYRHPYALADKGNALSWGESREVNSGFVKVEARQALNIESAVRLNGSYSWMDTTHTIIDRDFNQEEQRLFVEMIYDYTPVAGRNLLTAGVSYRKNRIADAPVWDGFLSDYLGADNPNLLPLFEPVSYDTRMASVFGQYTHKFGQIELMAGVRYDGHDAYEDATSYNMAAVWAPTSQWVLKLLHGTAFRTPYARQLRDEDIIEPEKIRNFTAQLAWKPHTAVDLAVCVFNNRIANHVLEDPYAGLSADNEQEIDGLEAQIRLTPWDALKVSANFTLLDNSGPDETYWYNNFTYFDEEGNAVKNYVGLTYPYDTGAKRLFNLSATWQPFDRLTTNATLSYIGPRNFIYPIGEVVTRCDEVWLLNATATVHRFLYPNIELAVYIRNVLDKEYEIPGTYSVIEGEPFSVQTMVRVVW